MSNRNIVRFVCSWGLLSIVAMGVPLACGGGSGGDSGGGSTGAPIIWSYGQTSGVDRLAKQDGRFFPWMEGGTQVSTWDGTKFYGLSLEIDGPAANAYQAEP